MANVEETPLPGVGIRYGCTTEGGQQLTVLHSHTGRHDLFSGDPCGCAARSAAGHPRW